MEKNDIISNSTNGDILLKTPFHWPQSMWNENEEINVELEGIDPSQAEEREMYIGSRTSSALRDAMEDLYRHSIQDINEGCWIAVLATEDALGYPF